MAQYETTLPRLTGRRLLRGLFWLAGHRFVTVACIIPAWFVAHDAQLHGEDFTEAFLLTLGGLVTANLLCRAVAKWLQPHLGFSGRVKAPPTAEAKVVPQPVRVAVKRHGGPTLRQVVRQLPPEVRALLR